MWHRALTWIYRLTFVVILFTLLYSLLRVEETFQDAPSSINNDAVKKKYTEFVAFYNPFMDTWEKAITTAAGLERPAPKEGDPVPSFTHDELNQYVSLLSQKVDSPLPQVTKPLPSELTKESMTMFISILQKTPADGYLRATEWMNARIKESQAGLQGALKGGVDAFKDLEGFQGSEKCSEFAACLDDPAFLDALAAAQEKRQTKKTAGEQEDLIAKMTQILGQGALKNALGENAGLRAESDRVKNQAQSGDLLQSMNLPSEGPSVSYQLPSGAGALKALQKNDPAKYKEYEKNQKPYMELKQLLDQINGGLR